MEFSLVPALVAGLVGTAVMSMMMRMAGSMGMTDMPPMELVTGSMMSAEPGRARQFGIMIHWIVMGTIVFGIIYALVFVGLDGAGWGTGLLMGIVHGLVVGLVFMPMMPAMHPRMSREPLPTGGTVDEASGSVQLAAPGVLGAGWGSMTPVGLVMGHAVYGLVVALVYGTLV